MAKYYTPSIEEFHVGFEYYENNELQVFGKDISICQLDYIDDYIREGFIKVKYLDKEDIESLGFTFQREDSYYNYYSKDNLEIQIVKNYSSETKFQYAFNIYDSEYPYSDEEYVKVFSGHIKNKSELKRLLKQLWINE